MKISCPWCKSENTQEFLEINDFFLTQEKFHIYECKECKLKFTTPVPEDLDHYYKSENYLSHSDTNKSIFARIYNCVRKINIRQKFNNSVGDLPQGKILDIGCGVGEFLNFCKNKGWEITGIEPSEEARKIAEKKLDTKIFTPQQIEELPRQQYDVITMWHVLEHVEDLHSEINELQRLLKPNGRLIIALPNHQSYDAQHYGKHWAAYDVPRHLSHFSKESIKNIFQNSNFQLVNTSGMKWDSFYISILSEKYKKSKLPFLKGLLFGLLSNIKAWKNCNYSSLIYKFAPKGI